MKNLKCLVSIVLVLGQASLSFASNQDQTQRSIQERLQAPERINGLKTKISGLEQEKTEIAAKLVDANNFIATVDEYTSHGRSKEWLDFKLNAYTLSQTNALTIQDDGKILAGAGAIFTVVVANSSTKAMYAGLAFTSASILVIFTPQILKKLLAKEVENINYIENTNPSVTALRYTSLQNSTIPALNSSLKEKDKEIKDTQDLIKSLE